MRIFNAIGYLALAALLSACDQRQAASDVDPMLGLECFETHRTSLPPGTQYEGIDQLAEDGITIRIMNGVDVTRVDCGLNPDGTLRGTDR